MTGAIPDRDPTGKQQVKYTHQNQRGNRNDWIRQVNVIRCFRFVKQLGAIAFVLCLSFAPLALEIDQADKK